jgi:hypothetical protein
MQIQEDGGILLPAPSRASRDVAKASKGHQSGSHVITTVRAPAGQRVQIESGGEGQFLTIIAADPDVVEIEEQPPAVEYVGLDGRKKRKTFDFRVTRADGARVAVEVKPAAIAERTGLLDELRCLAKTMPRAFADSISLVTDDDIDPIALKNAGVMGRYCRNADFEADDRTGALVACLTGTVAIEDIVKAVGLGHRGFGAVVRLIFRRRLRLVRHEYISYRALVQPVEAAR